jgi:hypothetical protein
MILTKNDRDNLEREDSCSTHKLQEVWNGIGQLIEKTDMKPFEERGSNPREKRFQVSAGTLESKPAEVGKSDACHDRRTQQLALNITAGIVGIKVDRECLQLRHE